MSFRSTLTYLLKLRDPTQHLVMFMARLSLGSLAPVQRLNPNLVVSLGNLVLVNCIDDLILIKLFNQKIMILASS